MSHTDPSIKHGYSEEMANRQKGAWVEIRSPIPQRTWTCFVPDGDKRYWVTATIGVSPHFPELIVRGTLHEDVGHPHGIDKISAFLYWWSPKSGFSDDHYGYYVPSAVGEALGRLAQSQWDQSIMDQIEYPDDAPRKGSLTLDELQQELGGEKSGTWTSDLTMTMAKAALDAIDAGTLTRECWSANESDQNWVGYCLMSSVFLSQRKDLQHFKTLFKDWIAAGYLAVETVSDREGRTVSRVKVLAQANEDYESEEVECAVRLARLKEF